jgi:hypothetical protein
MTVGGWPWAKVVRATPITANASEAANRSGNPGARDLDRRKPVCLMVAL